jgi:hypothetical protein
MRLGMGSASRELGTIRFYLQEGDLKIIDFTFPNPHWFEWCQQFPSSILLNLNT